MPVSRDLERLRQLEAEFDFLRDRVLKAARALVLVEDMRAQALARLGRHDQSATCPDLPGAVSQAGDNADTATAITVQADLMSRVPAARLMHLMPAGDGTTG